MMAVAGVQVLLFTIGVVRRSYLAIAVPVLGAIAAISGLLFWIGYTMVSMEPDAAELDMQEDEQPQAFSA